MNKRTTYEQLLARARREPTRKAHRDEEHRLQCACVQWFALRYPRLRGRLFAVPNGGRRDATTAAKLKAEGVVAGVADLILLKSNARYGALLIEMKTPTGRQSESQKEWQQLISAEGEYLYVVVRSLDEFIAVVTDYLKQCN